jgi:hypothetical protein
MKFNWERKVYSQRVRHVCEQWVFGIKVLRRMFDLREKQEQEDGRDDDDNHLHNFAFHQVKLG